MCLPQSPDPLEVGWHVGEQVDHGDAGERSVALAGEGAPVLAIHDLVAILEGGAETLAEGVLWKQSDDDAHGLLRTRSPGQSSREAPLVSRRDVGGRERDGDA
jgi:hypothetical protein